MVAALLQPGQRSALFEVAPAWNTTYRDRGHSIHFFYVNVGTAAQPEIARVEVPIWIAQDQPVVGLLHAAIVEQCKVSPGYPYVLARAHEIAVVTSAERAEFDRMIATQLGILENLAGGYLEPVFGGGDKEVAPFIGLVAILTVKPYGLFGKVKIEAGLRGLGCAAATSEPATPPTWRSSRRGSRGGCWRPFWSRSSSSRKWRPPTGSM